MSRELKRVALDFDWPMNKVWSGFLMPESIREVPCGHCDGNGTFGRAGGDCPRCAGEGFGWRNDAHKAAADAWEQSEPTAGPGYQMWESVSEGSPISPVFETPEGLAQWLADTGASASGRMTATAAEWLRMINGPGWAPTMILTGGRLMSGVEAMAAIDTAENAK